MLRGSVVGCNRDVIDATGDNNQKRSCAGADNASALLPNRDGCAGTVEIETRWEWHGVIVTLIACASTRRV